MDGPIKAALERNHMGHRFLVICPASWDANAWTARAHVNTIDSARKYAGKGCRIYRDDGGVWVRVPKRKATQ